MSTTKVIKKEAKVKEIEEKDTAIVSFAGISITQEDLNKLENSFKSARGRIEAAGKAAIEQGILRSKANWLGDKELAADSRQIMSIARTLYRQKYISKGDALALSRYVTLKRVLETLTDDDLIK